MDHREHGLSDLDQGYMNDLSDAVDDVSHLYFLLINTSKIIIFKKFPKFKCGN